MKPIISRISEVSFSSRLISGALLLLFSVVPFRMLSQEVEVPVSGVFPWEISHFSYNDIDYDISISVGTGSGEISATISVTGELRGDVTIPESFIVTTYNPAYSAVYNPDVPQTVNIIIPVMTYSGVMSENTELTSIVMPRYFVVPSFEGCTALQHVKFWINRYSGVPSFRDCTNLETVAIEGVNYSSVKDKYGLTYDESDSWEYDGSYSGGDFSGCTSLESIVYPAGQIDTGDFTGCTQLTTVEFGKGIDAIDMSKFFRCPALQKIGVPVSVRSIYFPSVYDEMVGQVDPFYYNNSFTGVYLIKDYYTDQSGDTVYATTPYIRYENAALSVAITDISSGEITGWDLVKVFRYGDYTLSKCKPYGTTSRYYYKVPEYVTSISNHAMYRVQFSNLWIGDSVRSIEREVLYPTYNFGSVVIGKNVSQIGGNAFFANELVFTGMTPPEASGFNPTSVFLGGDGVNYVHPDALQAYRNADSSGECDIRPIERVTDLKCDYRLDHGNMTANLEAITGTSVDRPVEFEESVNFFERSYTVNSVTARLDASKVQINKNIEVFEIPFGSNVAEYGVDAENRSFRDFDGVLYRVGNGSYSQPESLHMWPSLKNGECVIREGTRVARFVNCPGITSLSIPESLDSIYTEDYLPALKQLKIASLIKWMKVKGNNPACCGRGFVSPVEYICGGVPLTSVEVPAEISLRPGIFYGAANLETVTFAESADSTSIGDYAFANCQNLKNVSFAESLAAIGNNTFSYCLGLETVKLPHSVRSLGREVFYGDSSLTVLSLSPALENLPEGTAYGCNNLQSFIVPEGVCTLDKEILSGKKPDLTTISLPSTLESLSNDNSYYKAPSFRNLLPVTEIYSWAAEPGDAPNEKFDGLTLHVPAGTSEAYAAASGWSTAANIVDDLLIESNTSVDGNRIVVELPADPDNPALAVVRYVVDLYRLDGANEKTFIDSYVYGGNGQAVNMKAADERKRTIVIDNLAPATSYYYELKGYTANNDLVVNRFAELTTGTSSIDRPVTRFNDITLKDGFLYLPDDYSGMAVKFYSLDGRLVASQIWNNSPVRLAALLPDGIYIYKAGTRSGKLMVK